MTDRDDEKALLKHLSNELRRVSTQTKDMALYLKRQKDEQDRQDSDERTTLEEWQPVQTQYVSSYLEKCISRMNLHEESARYYTRKHYMIVIPATTMGVVTSTAAFTQWSGNVLCGQTSWVMLLVGGLMALTTLLHNLSEFVFGFKDKARQHQQSYINFSRLVKRIDNEYNNPTQEHKPYREFINSISDDYIRYTEHALMVPSTVDSMLKTRWIKNNEIAQKNPGLGEDHRNNENRIVQSSTINTAIDAATINSTTVAIKNIANKTDEDRINEAVDEYHKHRRLSPVSDDMIQEFKRRNALYKPKKGEGVNINETANETVAARYNVPSSASSSRRQSLIDSTEYSRRASGQTTTTTTSNDPSRRASGLTTATSGDSRRPSLIELVQQQRRKSWTQLNQEEENHRQPPTEERRRRSVVQFNVTPQKHEIDPRRQSEAVAFAKRANTLQQAAAKIQSRNGKNLPFDSFIELNAISSSSSSNSPPKTVAVTTDFNSPTSPGNLEAGFSQVRRHHREEIIEEPQQIHDPKEKRRRKKKKVQAPVAAQSLPLPETRDSQFSTSRYKLDFEKRNSFPRSLSTLSQIDQLDEDEEEDVTPDDVTSHVSGIVKYDMIPTNDGFTETTQN